MGAEPGRDLPHQFSFAPFVDQRGSWQRVWEQETLGGPLEGAEISEISVSSNPLPRTLRGMHSLRESYGEAKVVFCLSGMVQDVAIDVRQGLSTFGDFFSFFLHPGDGVVIPPGFAHGFLSLESNSNLAYLMTRPYNSSEELNFSWNDPFFRIPWACEPEIISEKDRAHAWVQV